ncbi:MAG: radical SAM protein [Candidatus Bathyarchaeota archaeon]|nr:radical SAM protein [Candidatus Bathyarchaeota archaeon]
MPNAKATVKMFKSFLKGQRKIAVFALTTKCNCKCIMCGMWRQPPTSINLDNALKILRLLRENNFFIVYFTGGEPSLHENVVEIVKFSEKLGLLTSLTTNGTVSKDLLANLKAAGLRLLSISLDHWKPEVCEKIRGVKGIMQKQVKALLYAKSLGLSVYALAYINPYLVEDDSIKKFVEYCNLTLQVPVGFCYPTEAEVNSYKLYGEFNEDELRLKLRKTVLNILEMKKSGYMIMNSLTYLEDILNSQESSKPNFYCKGGEDVVYIDWYGNVYPCFLGGRLFNLLEDSNPKFLKNVYCAKCFINCFREVSLIPQILKSPKNLLKEVLPSLKIDREFLRTLLTPG